MAPSLLNNYIIRPEWNVPDNIKSLQTSRLGGCSNVPFNSLNLAEHVDDNLHDVKLNRKKLAELLPSEPVWLDQIHSNTIVEADPSVIGIAADGSYTTQTNVVSVVMTADCLPVLVCNRQGNAVAAIHAGWRGLLNGILEQGVKKLITASQCRPEDLLVWLGPAIGPEMFEVGDEVRQAFLDKSTNKQSISTCFTASDCYSVKPFSKFILSDRKWLADIYQLARVRLSAIGVKCFFGGNYCTYKESDIFYSYRREGKTGRMASLIWIGHA